MSLEQLDLLLLTVAKPRQRAAGWHPVPVLRYIDPTLAAYVGEDVTIRYDPRDMAEIRVYHQERFLCRPCVKNSPAKPSVSKDIRARHRRKRELHPRSPRADP